MKGILFGIAWATALCYVALVSTPHNPIGTVIHAIFVPLIVTLAKLTT